MGDESSSSFTADTDVITGASELTSAVPIGRIPSYTDTVEFESRTSRCSEPGS